jgi:hypothetical protein
MSNTTLDLAAARARLTIIEKDMAGFYHDARFNHEVAISKGLSYGHPSFDTYRRLFQERDDLRALLGLPEASMQWPLQRTPIMKRA